VYDNPWLPPTRSFVTLPGAGPYNDIGAVGNAIQISLWQSGMVSRLTIAAAAGGSAINSLDATNYQDGWPVLIRNGSSTDTLTFNHLGGGGAANQFSNMNGAAVTLPPLGAAWAHREVTASGAKVWQFA
jgi:hypothetical protein